MKLKKEDRIVPPDMDKAPPCWAPHNHNCQSCDTVWHHDPVDILKAEEEMGRKKASEIHDLSHTCPNCGERQGYTDGSGKAPTLLHNGIVTKPFEPSDQPPEDEDRRKKRMRLEFDVFMAKLMG